MGYGCYRPGNSYSGTTIGTNARHTKIIGGVMLEHNPVDNGVSTTKDTPFGGLIYSNSAKLRGRPEGWDPALQLSKLSDGGFEQLASFGLEGSTDSFTVENQINDTGAFAPLWRSNQLSANLPTWVEGFHLQTNLKQANDTGTAPLIVFAGKTDTTPFTIGTTRPILGIWNNTTTAYNFYTDRFDLINKKLVNVSEVAQNPVSKRWGTYQPLAGATAGTVGQLDGILAAHNPTGPGTDTNTFDTTEGVLINLATTTTINQNAGLVSPTGGVGVGRRLFGMKAIIRCKVDAVASSVSRFYFGFTSATALPLTDTPLANTNHGVIVGFNSTDANYTIRTNDGATSVTSTALSTPTAKNTSFHTITIEWTASGNVVVTFDNIVTTVSTDLPATTANLYFNAVVQNATAAIRTLSIKGVWIEAVK